MLGELRSQTVRGRGVRVVERRQLAIVVGARAVCEQQSRSLAGRRLHTTPAPWLLAARPRSSCSRASCCCSYTTRGASRRPTARCAVCGKRVSKLERRTRVQLVELSNATAAAVAASQAAAVASAATAAVTEAAVAARRGVPVAPSTLAILAKAGASAETPPPPPPPPPPSASSGPPAVPASATTGAAHANPADAFTRVISLPKYPAPRFSVGSSTPRSTSREPARRRSRSSTPRRPSRGPGGEHQRPTPCAPRRAPPRRSGISGATTARSCCRASR